MNDAIREDVSAELEQTVESVSPEDVKEQIKAEIHSRDRVIEDIAQRFHEKRLRDLGIEPDQEAEAAAEAPAEPEYVEPVPDAAPVQKSEKQAAPDAPVYLRDGEYYTRLKVNGQEQEVPFSKVQATMQKHVSADQRLQYASELLRRAEERDRVLRDNEAKLRSRPVQPSVADADEPDHVLKARAQKVINKLLDGETEQAADDLVKMLKARKVVAPAPDLGELERRAAEKAMSAIEQREYQRDLQKGNQAFAESYPEIMSDPDLFALADQKTIEISREKPYLTPSQVLMEAGDVVMRKFVRREAPTPAAVSSSRQERKTTLKPMPKPASARQVKPAPQPLPMSTPSDYLAEIRRMRGQGR